MGTMLSYQLTKRFGLTQLPEGSVHVKLAGSAGQSLGAWLAPGVTLEVIMLLLLNFPLVSNWIHVFQSISPESAISLNFSLFC